MRTVPFQRRLLILPACCSHGVSLAFQVMKRREVLTHKLDMLKRAQSELSNVDV